MATSTGGVAGVQFQVVASTATPWQNGSIDRAVTSTGVPSSSSTKWRYLVEVPQGTVYSDQTPNDGIVRHYRVKGTYPGSQPSTYSAVISATPVELVL